MIRLVIFASLFSLAYLSVLERVAFAAEHGLVGKFVTAVAVDPSHPTTVYAATRVDGVFKSRNRGMTWTAINTGLPLPADGGVLVVDPVTPNTLYYGDRGLFKSTDAGKSWSNLLADVFVRTLALHPGTSTLYASTEPLGVIKSTDGGISWSSVTDPGFTPAALVLDPRSPLIAYVTNPEANKSGSILKTIDGGVSWTLSDAGLPLDFVPAFATVGVNALAIDPEVPTTLYAGTEQVVDERLPGIGGVFKSTDEGLHWTASSNGLPPNTRVSVLLIDPANHNTLYALTPSGPTRAWTGEPRGLSSTPV